MDRIYEKSANLLGLDRGLDFYFPISGSGSWIGFFWIFFWIWILDRIFLDFFLDLDLGSDFFGFFPGSGSWIGFFGFFPGSGFFWIFSWIWIQFNILTWNILFKSLLFGLITHEVFKGLLTWNIIFRSFYFKF